LVGLKEVMNDFKFPWQFIVRFDHLFGFSPCAVGCVADVSKKFILIFLDDTEYGRSKFLQNVGYTPDSPTVHNVKRKQDQH
jgi:hypothetical protein